MNKKLIFLLAISTILVILPTLLKATTIYDVQYNETNRGTGDDCYPSPEENNTVTITGVVTGVTTNTTYDNFWIQEASGLWRGIYVFDNYIHPSRGDSIRLTGLIKEYYGLTEIDPDPDAHQILATGVSEPDPIKVTCAELADGCSVDGESYEGVLVRIDSVVVTQDLNEHGEWYVSDDGGATECQIDDRCFHYDPTVGDNLTYIIGAVHYSYSEYEINPRDLNDIALPGALPPVVSNTIHTPSFPTSNDTVTVTTKVTDDEAVTSVWLFFSPTEAQFDSVEMLDNGIFPDTLILDSIYTAQIHPQIAGIEIKYYIKAIDDSSLVTTDPANAPASTYSYTVVAMPGDGTGTATISPAIVTTSQVVTETLTIAGDGTHTLAQVSVTIPNGWIWPGSNSDVSLTGNGFSGATFHIESNTISVSGATVTDENIGVMIISNLTTPQASTISTFVVKTAVTNGTLTEIVPSPQVAVQGETITSICDIQNNPSEYVGKIVTVRGIVTIGAGVIDISALRAYVQDNCGKGINIFDFDLSFTNELVRGYLVTVKGTVEDYGGHTTEIKNPSEVTVIDTSAGLPPPAMLTTEEALAPEWDGTWIQVTGTVEEKRTGVGGGTNITINDGAEDLMVRVWDVTHIDLDSVIVEEIYTIRGVSAYYTGGGYYQLTPGYQEDIEKGTPIGEGIGVATISPNTVDFATSNISEKITIRSDSVGITLTQVEIDIPSGWVWETPDSMSVNFSGPGFPATAFFDASQSDSSKIVIVGTAITDVNSGTIEIIDLTSPSYPGSFTFQVKTAYDDQKLELIKYSPRVYVKGVEKATLTVPPHPFAPDLGERLKIKYTAPANNDMVLKLFDLAGRVVVTLFDGLSSGGWETRTWDGRNELFERVPIGVYILYLQATDRKTGETTTAKAPVVVATRLD